VRRESEDRIREFDARPSMAALTVATDEPTPALEAQLRFLPRALVRPEELVALLLPAADPRTADVERTALWAEVGGERLDPLALLGART
jgi:hypothetical protein